MDKLQPKDFTMLQQCADILDLCVDSEEQRAELVRRMEVVTQHMDQLRSTVASLPGISISQRDQEKQIQNEMSLLDDFAEYESSSARRRESTSGLADTSNEFATGHKDDGLSGFGAGMTADVDGYITTTLEAENAPIFSLDTVQFQVPNKIISLTVSNDVLILVIEGAKILRIRLQEAHNILEANIPVNPVSLRACNVFLDPTGRHLLISTPQGESFYYHEGWDSAKPLSRLKNMEITAVAWNGMAWTTANSSTRTILLGTHDGKIYETELRPTGDAKAKRSDIPARCVAELPMREKITGIAMEVFPSRRKQHLVMVATGTRLYQVIGAADLESRSSDKGTHAVFEVMLREGLASPNFQEIPGMPGPGSLAVHHRESPLSNGRTQAVATDFAWLTSMGVFFGRLTFRSQEPGDSVVENAALLPYPPPLSTSEQNGEDAMVVEHPLSLALTEFHIVLQYSDNIRALNMLSNKPVYEQWVESSNGVSEVLQGLTVDETKGTYWLFSPDNIYELVVTDEDRDVWDIYLSRRQFDAALQHCYNDAQRDMVLRAQADHLFASGDYVKSAECFARTSVSFEEAALKFVDMHDGIVLKSYLLSKLQTLRKQDRTQVTLVVMWLVEIYLGLIGDVEASILTAGPTTASSKAQSASASRTDIQQQKQPEAVSSLESKKASLQSELYALVGEYKTAVDPNTTYQLAESHGRREFWLHYAMLRGDYGRVVEYYMEREDHIQAIEALGHYGTPEMFYKYAPALMSAEPAVLVEVLMRQPDLAPSKLIPTLMRYEQGGAPSCPNHAMRYLRFCIQKQMCRDPIVYNYYLTLLAKDSLANDESELMLFLTTYGKDMLYDPDYALRMCKRYGRIQSCVHLYSLLRLYEDAVELALKQGDIELAQIHAERPDDDKLCKRLWLKIAQHAIDTKEPASEVMELVRRSNRLGVEDILPFFPDFTCVDDFKDDICIALEDYDAQIQELRSEMDESTRSAEAMQRDITNIKNRFAILNADEACQTCGQPLWLRQFYVFPCQHSFHSDCLTRQIVGSCNRVQRRRIHELQSQGSDIAKQRRQLKLTPLIGSKQQQRDGKAVESDEQLEQQHRRVKQQLDALVAGECVLCGEPMIKTISEPFIDADLASKLAVSATAVNDDTWAI
ncbi:tethering complex subunit [Coemansia sp. RSA 1933]|nr:tethering complex subunit [Coemansia sp. RSA 1933]